jgi:hypothetical protein
MNSEQERDIPIRLFIDLVIESQSTHVSKLVISTATNCKILSLKQKVNEILDKMCST